jgi:hypothetical protein
MDGWPREMNLSGKLLLAQAAISVEETHNRSVNVVQRWLLSPVFSALSLLSVSNCSAGKAKCQSLLEKVTIRRFQWFREALLKR